MVNLVLKDILMQKKSTKDLIIAILLNFSIICILQFLGAASVYILTPSIFAISLITSSCGFGEKNDVDRMINSLPVSRKEIVISKYLSSFVFLIIGIAITVLFSYIIKFSELSHINRFMNLTDIIIVSIFTVVYISVYLPIYLWLGYIKSQLINKVLNYFIFICLIITVVMVTLIDNGNAKDALMNFVILPNFELYMVISFLCCSIILISISIFTSFKVYINKDL
ncbi:ABC-2 transporter permease [Clostridium estertheticum]|uniref:ABC-2 transporter permease n=1 Tax=Clostridium estertheticum TaxID=238834 RepID=UPI001C7CE02F|nr:ABC-2 transporter permease [Clostridium estertheticum]MBX4261899.1 ABC-2 transporter permease [Clostridium estertheticum]WLC72196.1 ABC-2 transporter permease [Clostridium estertheticum]